MAARGQADLDSEEAEIALARDERWLMVQRIVESSSFERALQLRKILLYVSRCAIQHPERVIREYDIACDVLERRKDFDPANDNIVRSQFSNLRRKLDLYFHEEGKQEPFILKVPKGSYLPVFVPVREQLPPPPFTVNVPVDASKGDLPSGPATAPSSPAQPGATLSWSRRDTILAALCLLPALALGLVLASSKRPLPPSQQAAGSGGNAFVRFIAQWDGEANVIVPDTSLVSLQVALNLRNVPLPDYANGQYPARELAFIKDPAVRDVLAGIASLRNTTFNEAMIASDFVSTMRRLGLNARPRYARDLHVSDLNEGNTVVIGGASSDPWLSLFADKMNFHFIEQPRQNRYYFLNAKPAPGEQPVYTVTYSRQGGDAEGYVDIGLTQNPSHTGYVLLINASDEQEVESAANLLLRGKLPPEISSLLAKKDLHYFELFFRGRHIAGQADNSLELVAYRPL